MSPTTPAVLAIPSLLLALALGACTSDSPITTDAPLPPYGDGGLDGEGDGSDSSSVDADAAAPSCQATDNVEVVATALAETLKQELAEEGFELLDSFGGGVQIRITTADVERFKKSATEAPTYYGTEAEVLALPEGDEVREAYEKGDISPPNWDEQGLLSVFALEPYTDEFFFTRNRILVTVLVRLDACLDSGTQPDPLPKENLRHTVHKVPKMDAVELRTRSSFFRVREFARDPAWQQHPQSPLIHRQGSGGGIGRVGSDLTMWVNGYSGASGFIFRATSSDGLVWDFAWDNAHTCVFEGMPDIQVYKRDPTVVADSEGWTMWLQIDSDNDTAPSYVTRLHRTQSVDGLNWSKPVRLQGSGLDGLSKPYVIVEEGLYHLFAQSSSGIVHATSSDGVTWDGAAKVLLEGETIDDIDGFGAFTPAVVRIGERWVMLYAAAYSPREGRDGWNQPIWYQMHLTWAVSDDGVTWEKSGVPIWSQTRAPGHWESGNLGRPMPLQQGLDTWVYYTGVDRGEPSVGLLVGSDWGP